MSDSTSPMPRMREATRSGWNGSSASSFSPVPANTIGLPVTARSGSAAPPRASPSILVSTTPETGGRRAKPSAAATASWPVMASATRGTWWGVTAATLRSSSRMSSSSTVCRPAVSISTVSRPRARAAATPSRAIATASPPVVAGWTGSPSSRASVSSCRVAAGRYTSAGTRYGVRPRSACSQRASFAVVVVFPDPLRPTSITTTGVGPPRSSAAGFSPSRRTSSRCTSFTKCCSGVRLRSTSAPSASRFTASTKSRTTFRLTSASRRARRTSRSASSMFRSVIFPCPRSLRSRESNFSPRDSNIAGGSRRSGTRDGTVGGLGCQETIRGGPMRMRPSTTTAPFPGASTFTGLRSSSRSSGTTSTSAETLDDGGEGVLVSRGHSSIAVEQRGRAQLADHLGGVDVGDRGQVERHVAQQLDQHAAEAAHQERPEGRIGRHTDQRFEATLHLALEEDALEVGADRSHARHQGVDRASDGSGGVESEYHAADVTLVDDPGRDRLRHQRKPQALGGGDGFGGRDLLGGGELDAGRAQHGGEVARREPARPLGAGEDAVDYGADGALLEPAELEGRAARPRPPAPVPLRGGEGQRRVLRIAVRGELAARPRAEERRRALRGDEDREDRLVPGDGARAARDRLRDLLGVGHQRRPSARSDGRSARPGARGRRDGWHG